MGICLAQRYRCYRQWWGCVRGAVWGLRERVLDEIVGTVWADDGDVQEVLVCVHIVCLTVLLVGRYIAKDAVTQ